MGCPEPGIEYAQALVNGYWVVIKATERCTILVRGATAASAYPDGYGHSPPPPDARDSI